MAGWLWRRGRLKMDGLKVGGLRVDSMVSMFVVRRHAVAGSRAGVAGDPPPPFPPGDKKGREEWSENIREGCFDRCRATYSASVA